jgi:hypothetical protein
MFSSTCAVHRAVLYLSDPARRGKIANIIVLGEAGLDDRPVASSTTQFDHYARQAALADQLSAERAGREDADRRIQELEQSLARVSEEKVDWQMIATERQAAARMSEVSDAQVTKTPGAVWGCVTRFRSEVADVRCCRYGFMRCHKRMSTGGSSR